MTGRLTGVRTMSACLLVLILLAPSALGILQDAPGALTHVDQIVSILFHRPPPLQTAYMVSAHRRPTRRCPVPSPVLIVADASVTYKAMPSEAICQDLI